MSFLRIAVILCTLLPALSLKGQQQRDSVLNRIISVYADNKPVAVILEEITRENDIFFSYDASLIPFSKLISVRFEQQKVSDVLEEIFHDQGFLFYGKDDHVVISAKGSRDMYQHGTAPFQLSPMLVITGKVLDHTTREPMSDVGISLLNQPVGTITNADGEFILKLPPENMEDTLLFSSLGYARKKQKISHIQKDGVITLHSMSIRIREVKVKAVAVEDILASFRKNINRNYATDHQLLTGFYRETLRQDEAYINVSEAVLEILKAPYNLPERNDRVRLLKARRSPDVQPYHWVNFKLQGGPSTITMLDVAKKLETFLDPEYEILYRYTISQVIWYKNHPVYVIRFRPVKDIVFPCFEGEVYIDRESYALVYARFSLADYGLALAEESLIRKKPPGFKVKPQYLNYQVDFSEYEGKWHLHTARAAVAFRVRSPKNRVNSVFHSVSDLLITDVRSTSLKRFPVKDLFTVNDVFAEMVLDYDEKFWGNYNIIKPDEDLQEAVRHFLPEQKPAVPEFQ